MALAGRQGKGLRWPMRQILGGNPRKHVTPEKACPEFHTFARSESLNCQGFPVRCFTAEARSSQRSLFCGFFLCGLRVSAVKFFLVAAGPSVASLMLFIREFVV